jgi:hypothetical protein
MFDLAALAAALTQSGLCSVFPLSLPGDGMEGGVLPDDICLTCAGSCKIGDSQPCSSCASCQPSCAQCYSQQQGR